MFYINLLINHGIFKANIISFKDNYSHNKYFKIYYMKYIVRYFFYISENVIFDEKLYFLILHSLIMMYL